MSELLIKDCIYRVIDCESTSADPATAKVVEVAFRDVDFDGNVHSQFSRLCNPGVPIPPSASAVHHIVDEDVVGFHPVDVSADLLVAEVYVAHNAEYDSAVLGLKDATWVCTHRLAKHLWPDIVNHSNQEIRYTLKLKPDIAPGTPHHRAAADVAVTAAILKAALPLALEKWPTIRTVGELAAQIKAPCLLTWIPFHNHRGTKFADAETSFLEWIVNKGAGGEDCIFTANHYLEQRFGKGGASDYGREPCLW